VDLVLLGAGASVEAGVPASFDMTRELVERVNNPRLSPTAQALNFICGTLVGHDSASGQSPYEGLDVERVFAAVELLAERRTLEVTPFVSTWHPGVDAWDRPLRRGMGFDRELQQVLLQRSTFNRAEKLITQLVDSRTGAGGGHAYKRLADEMIDQLRDLVATRPKQLAYLMPLIRRGSHEGGLTVATLNYDRSIEQAGEVAGVSVHTDPGMTPVSKFLVKEGVRLLKLHGSIDWVWDDDDRPPGMLRQNRVRELKEGEHESRRPALVFGSRAKLQADGPFLTLLANFEEALSWTTRLVVVGYSFRDPHINAIIRRWTTLPGDIVIIDPAMAEDPQSLGDDKDFRTEMIRDLNPRYFGIGPQRRPRVRLLQATAGEGLRELFGDA
jgi:SIR2-like domain